MEYNHVPPKRVFTVETTYKYMGRMKPKPYVPKTALGKKLVALRNAAIANGMPLMTAEEISEELARRRGEIE